MRLPRHFAGLDGVRAVAVGGVIALHLGCPGSALGWTGVNLFFVLSGFLITGILLEDKGSQHYYATFYCRRSLRIFPIYYLTIATLAFAGIATGESISHLPYFATYTQNWLYALYDVHVQFPWGASHTWSLAIEEQFYLLWPLAVAMLPEQALLKLVVLIIILGNLSRDLVMHLNGAPATHSSMTCLHGGHSVPSSTAEICCHKRLWQDWQS